jgi:2-dehydropantoate 2-reductase
VGHKILPIFGMKPEDVRQSNRLVETLLDTLLQGFVLPATKTTVLQDWMKGRHSEVNDINGTVVTEAARRGSRAPVNAAVVELARRIERGELKPGPQNLKLLKELAGS